MDDMNERRLRRLVAEATGADVAALEVRRLAGHASTRTYWRVGDAGGGRSVVVMVLPPNAPPDEIGKEGARGVAPFVDIQRYLAGIGVRVPKIFAWSQEAGYVLLEDLGDDMMVSRLGTDAEREPLYRAAVDQLAFMRVRAEQAPDPSCVAFQRRYDYDVYFWELEHFLEWALRAGKGAELTPAEQRVVDVHFDAIARRLAAEPAGFTHRDYQSRNLMVGREGELVVIDFQDALLGPRQYDLVALLRDSYVALPMDFVAAMIRRYLEATEELGGPELEGDEFREVFDLLTIQRKLKDAGRFVYIDRVKGNPDFLRFVPAALGYVRAALARRPELAALQEALGRHVPELAAP
jgi:aminoglycoside/choline kinase family phosphotransferase